VKRETRNDKLQELLDINNFVGVTIRGKNVAIHKILLIKIESIWYMCESYNGSYTMKIREVDAYQLLAHMDTEMYLDLYENEDNKCSNYYCRLNVDIGLITVGYEDRLLSWLDERI